MLREAHEHGLGDCLAVDLVAGTDQNQALGVWRKTGSLKKPVALGLRVVHLIREDVHGRELRLRSLIPVEVSSD